MLFTSKRRGSALAVPFFMLGWTAFLIALAVLLRHYVFYALLALAVMAAIHELRRIRRAGPFLETWEPELWAPLRRGRMNAQDVQVLVRTTSIGRQRGYELVVGAPGAPAELCSRVVVYLRKRRALRIAVRLGDVLGLTSQDETEITS